MFKLIGWILKASVFALVILVASHLIKWNGRTVSDQVRSTLSSAEKSPALKTVKKKSKAIFGEAKDAASEIPDHAKAELQALIHDDSERKQ